MFYIVTVCEDILTSVINNIILEHAKSVPSVQNKVDTYLYLKAAMGCWVGG